jgi:hypothetical protein
MRTTGPQSQPGRDLTTPPLRPSAIRPLTADEARNLPSIEGRSFRHADRLPGDATTGKFADLNSLQICSLIGAHLRGVDARIDRGGLLYLILALCVRTRTTGPHAKAPRDLTTPTRGLERTHSPMLIGASGQNQISILATAMSALTPNELTSSAQAGTSEKCHNRK